ncbi:MAG: ABC transporter ATP-binding protein, partial [Candidatus Kapabacteria bacterium]|nr:ABC transporter ATP-binding protein [Candidatus Kapabacteria bacterium]
ASRMSDANAGFMTTLQEGISGIRIIKAFNGEGIIGKRFRQHSVDYLRNSVKMTRVNDLVPSISEIFVIAALCVVLYVGGDMVFAVPQQMKGAELMTFLFALFAIMSPVNAITSVPSNIQRGLVAAEKVYAVIDQEPTIIDGTQTITSFKENVTFNNVTFAYNTDDVVKNVTLSIPYGKKVALVGASGSGKSTLVDLLIRFYDPKSGTITMDGLDIKNLTLESYRSRFGIVSQEAILFNDTIANNIAFGAKEINQSDIENAARIAYADEFIKHLPDGYNTYIGDRGVMLSGGQRQRIAIARAIAQNPDILIFDEATSALDSESEKIVQNAINNVLENRTAVIVAHRLSTIINADLIVVFDRGVIAEQGTHKELIDMNGIYKRLYTIQYSQHEETH